MASTLLIAETDYRTLDGLPRILADHIPGIVIDTCISPYELSRNVENFSYNAIALSPIFIRDYRVFTQQRTLQLLAPLLVTVRQRDLPLAHAALDGDAFDLIVKPIVPDDAAQTVRLALWQNKLLQLLASKKKMSSRFQEHMNAFPEDTKAAFMNVLETTCQNLTTSLRILERIESQNALLNMATLVGRRTRQRALDRLLNLHQDGPSH